MYVFVSAVLYKMENAHDLAAAPSEEKMSPQELAAKLDADLDAFIDGLEKKAYTEGWPEDRWQEVANNLFLFSFCFLSHGFVQKCSNFYCAFRKWKSTLSL